MKTLIKTFILLFVLSSCGGGGDDGPSIPDPKPTPNGGETKELGAFDLVFPENNLICTEGKDVSDNEVAIEFLWKSSANATSYTLDIKNIDTGKVTNVSSTVAEKKVNLPKDTQFSWTVTAVLGDKTSKSAQWNFYSEGIAEENFAPFPAAITLKDNKDGTVRIDWPSTDLDDDIETYDIYLGTDPDPEISLSGVAYTSVSAQSINYNTDYYLVVVTKDSRGNTATSKKQFNFQG